MDENTTTMFLSLSCTQGCAAVIQYGETAQKHAGNKGQRGPDYRERQTRQYMLVVGE